MLGLYDKKGVLVRTFITTYDVGNKLKLTSREVLKKMQEIEKRGYSVIICNKKIHYLRKLENTASIECRKRRRVSECSECLHHGKCDREGE